MIKVLCILSILLFSCCSDKIKVYMDDGLSKEGVKAWGRDIKFMDHVVGDVFNQPDVMITFDPDLKLLGACYWDGVSEKPKTMIIQVRVNNDVVIAHEFGHFLGYFDNEEYGSIMFPSYEFTNKPLSWFNEFK